MQIKFRNLTLSALAAAGFVMLAPLGANAGVVSPAAVSVPTAQSAVVDVQYRHRRHYRHHYRRHHHRRHYRPRSGIYFGFGSPGYYGPPVYGPPVYYGRRYVAPARGLRRAHVRWCYNHYRSYRASDNTYQPYHGPRRQCRSPY